MVQLRKNRKGMIAIVDALVFLALLSVVAIGLFGYSAMTDTDEPMAKTVTEQLFETEVRTSDLCSTGDSEIQPLYVITAVNLNTGYTERTETFIRETLGMMLPEYCGYDMTVEYKGHSMNIHRDSDRELSSEYSTDTEIEGAGALHTVLLIY